MSTSAEAVTPRLSEEVDTVTDLLDQFYSNAWYDEERIEEQEDVSLYGLYDHCSPPVPGPISPLPSLKRDPPLQHPFDQKLLAEKLWNYMELAARSTTPDFKHEQQKFGTTQHRANTPITTPKAEQRGSPLPITRHCQESNHNPHQKLDTSLLPQVHPFIQQAIGLEPPQGG